mmetsp:Transcript_47672/g.55137  ORF Transcript_47672/g.55137 Transcript_47672/m.55137 type:complete len:95 (+) Transcript_47672:32-316(+)
MGKYTDLLNDPSKLSEAAKEIFVTYDTDKSGFIEPSEFRKALYDLNAKIGDPEVSEGDYKEAFKDFDENGDNKLSLEEFSRLITLFVEALASKE